MKPVLLLTCMPVLCASAFGDTKPTVTTPVKPPANRGLKQDASIDALDARVMLSSPGTLVIDRGSVDLVAIGDAVVMKLKDGTTQRGSVSGCSSCGRWGMHSWLPETSAARSRP